MNPLTNVQSLYKAVLWLLNFHIILKLGINTAFITRMSLKYADVLALKAHL